mmetsp:Transcript_7339/g.31282  ORF Transcript_7339/g.31282 Transcript_7339/m.31282 type:complete len:225 (-) Transcript_7339:213-887(-)
MGWKKTASPGSKAGQTRNDSSKSGFFFVPATFCNAETDSTAPSYASRKDLGASPSRCVRPRTSNPPFPESLTSIATTTFTPPNKSNSQRASGFRKDASWCQAKPLPSENGAFVFTWSTAQRIRVEFVSDKHTVSAMSLMRSERTSAANAPPRLEGEPILRSAPARMASSDFRPDALCVSKKTPLCLRERVNVFASSSSASVAACRASTSAASATPRTTTQPSRS